MLNCHWKMAREVGADFTCPCPGHCETWLIHQKLTACRSHLLSHAIHVCKRTKWKLQKKMLLLGLEAKRNSGFCKDWLYTKKRDTKFCSTEALFDSLEGLLCVHWIALSYIQLIVTHCNHTMRKKISHFQCTCENELLQVPPFKSTMYYHPLRIDPISESISKEAGQPYSNIY